MKIEHVFALLSIGIGASSFFIAFKNYKLNKEAKNKTSLPTNSINVSHSNNTKIAINQNTYFSSTLPVNNKKIENRQKVMTVERNASFLLLGFFILLCSISFYNYWIENPYIIPIKKIYQFMTVYIFNSVQVMEIFILYLSISYAFFTFIKWIFIKKFLSFLEHISFLTSSFIGILTSIQFLIILYNIRLHEIWPQLINTSKSESQDLFFVLVNFLPFYFFIGLFIFGWCLMNLIIILHTDSLDSSRIYKNLLGSGTCLAFLYFIKFIIPYYSFP